MKTIYKLVDDKYIFFKEKNDKAIVIAELVNKNEVFIDLLSVDRKYRGKRFASYLLAKFLAFVKSLGFKHVKLDVIPTNNNISASKLKSFYKRFGFKETNSRDKSHKNLMKLTVR